MRKGAAKAKAAGSLSFDADKFGNRVRAVCKESKPSESEEERHLARIELWTTALGVAGLLLAVRGVISPLSMIALGIYKFAKFAILAHHSLHGGWGRSRRGWFGSGIYRRTIDWMDWIFPAAWIAEHNKVHHYKLNEDADPDFVERNTEAIQNWEIPKVLKYAMVAFFMATWKWFYYASNTLKLLHVQKQGAPSKVEFDQAITLQKLAGGVLQGNPWYCALAADLTFRVMGPPFFLHFLALPLAAGCLQSCLYGSVAFPFCWVTLANIMGAELVTNAHAFSAIVTNHAGADLWWFDGPCAPDSPEFYLRAILGSTAYPAGTDLIDYLHGYLNYQAEHHAFPDLTPLHYQRFHPRLKKVCAEFGVPYVQENMLIRTKKTADIIVGNGKHKRLYGQATEQPELWMVAESRKD